MNKELNWLLEQAKENRGMHTGGPYIEDFDAELAAAKKAVKQAVSLNRAVKRFRLRLRGLSTTLGSKVEDFVEDHEKVKLMRS